MDRLDPSKEKNDGLVLLFVQLHLCIIIFTTIELHHRP